MNLGAPAEKLVLGLPTYGRSFTLQDATKHEPPMVATGGGQQGSITREGHSVWISPKISQLNFWILAFFTDFCPIKTDLSGNTVWPQASGLQKLAKMDHFWHFSLTFVHSKCKRSSLRSQHWMRLFLWFSNTVAKEYRWNWTYICSFYISVHFYGVWQ